MKTKLTDEAFFASYKTRYDMTKYRKVDVSFVEYEKFVTDTDWRFGDDPLINSALTLSWRCGHKPYHFEGWEIPIKVAKYASKGLVSNFYLLMRVVHYCAAGRVGDTSAQAWSLHENLIRFVNHRLRIEGADYYYEDEEGYNGITNHYDN